MQKEAERLREREKVGWQAQHPRAREGSGVVEWSRPRPAADDDDAQLCSCSRISVNELQQADDATGRRGLVGHLGQPR